jgi:thiamine-phosphate diphosphorylase/hydroxyethylthiazole kinase
MADLFTKKKFDPSLCILTDRKLADVKRKPMEQLVREAIKGGVTLVQVREKDATTKDFVTEALKIKEVTDEYEMPLIINDRVDVALAIDAAGVHLGVHSMSVAMARKILGDNKIIGATVVDVDDAVKAQLDGADYLAYNAKITLDTIIQTYNKTEITKDTVMGLDGLRLLTSHPFIHRPLVATGGIDSNNAAQMIEVGCAGVAVVRGIFAAENVQEEAQKLVTIVKTALAKYWQPRINQINDTTLKLIEQFVRALTFLKRKCPLIHHMANMMTMNDIANATKFLGAVPLLAHAPNEEETAAAKADCLVLDLVTLDPYLVDSMLKAVQAADNQKVPIVLNCGGVGTTEYRTNSALSFLSKLNIAILRGNANEIPILLGEPETVEEKKKLNPLAIASRVAQKFNTTVVISGRQDIITDGARCILVNNGHHALTEIAGSGSIATALIGCFAAIMEDKVEAAALGMVCLGVAAELAAPDYIARGPYSFKVSLFDKLATLTPQIVQQMTRVCVFPME